MIAQPQAGIVAKADYYSRSSSSYSYYDDEEEEEDEEGDRYSFSSVSSTDFHTQYPPSSSQEPGNSHPEGSSGSQRRHQNLSTAETAFLVSRLLRFVPQATVPDALK